MTSNLNLLENGRNVVKVVDSCLACPEFEPYAAEHIAMHGGPMHVKHVEAQTSSYWCGVELLREECQLKYRPRYLTVAQN
ncbi:UNVERIFIED_CONTAM: hypothetical protein NCL1_20646 [Trichonephila clavipes]